MRATLLLPLLLLSNLIFSQQELIYSSVYGESNPIVYGQFPPLLVLDKDDNLYTSSVFNSSVSFENGSSIIGVGGEDIYLKKTDPNGNILWSIALQSSDDQRVHGMSTDSEGNLILTGQFAGSMDFDPSPNSQFMMESTDNPRGFILKLNPNGDFIWAKMFGSDTWLTVGETVAVDENDDVYVGGDMGNLFSYDDFEVSESVSSGFMLKAGGVDGELMWFKNIGEVDNEANERIVINEEGAYMISTKNLYGVIEPCLARLNKQTGQYTTMPISNSGLDSRIRSFLQGKDGKLYVIFDNYNDDGERVSTNKFIMDSSGNQISNISGIYITAIAIDKFGIEYQSIYGGGELKFNPTSSSYTNDGDGSSYINKKIEPYGGIKNYKLEASTYFFITQILLDSQDQIIAAGIFVNDISLDANSDEPSHSSSNIKALTMKWSNCPVEKEEVFISGCAPQEYDGITIDRDLDLVLPSLDSDECITLTRIKADVDTVSSQIYIDQYQMNCQHDDADYKWYDNQGNLLSQDFQSFEGANDGKYIVEINTDENCEFVSVPITLPEYSIYGPVEETKVAFGYAIETYQNELFVSGREGSFDGKLFYYHWDGVNWNLNQVIEAPIGNLGFTISRQGEWLAVGSRYSQRKVELFRKSGDQFIHHSTLTGDMSLYNLDFFGGAVLVQDNTLLVGDPSADRFGTIDVGVVLEFQFVDNEWLYIRDIENPNFEPGSKFGKTLYFNNNRFYITAAEDSFSAVDGRGKIHMYDKGIETIGNLLFTLDKDGYNGYIKSSLGFCDNSLFIQNATRVVEYEITPDSLIEKNDLYVREDGDELMFNIVGKDDQVLFSLYNRETNLAQVQLWEKGGDEFKFVSRVNGYNKRENFGLDLALTDEMILIGAPDAQLNEERVGNVRYYLQNQLTSVEKVFEPLRVNVYPNPVENLLNVELEESELEKIVIYNCHGSVVYVGNETKINIRNFSPGLYFINITNNKGSKLISKFIKI